MTAFTTGHDGARPRRVLIVLFGAIGDVVRALPLLGRIRKGWPDAHIAWAVEPKSAPILQGHPWLDDVILYDRNRTPWSVPSFIRRVRAGRFDLAIDLQRISKSGLVAWASGAPKRIGFHSCNTKEWNHLFSNVRVEEQPDMRLKLMQYQAFGDALDLPETDIEFGLAATDEERRRARELLKDAPRPLVAAFLGSSWPSRIYPAELTAETIRNLASSNGAGPALYPVLIGGPDEARDADLVMRALNGRALNLVGRTTLRDLVAIFRECEASFGPDCGPMHISAAVGCPVISLWGATAPERSAPWGFADFTLHGEIPCHPCYLRRCPVGRECMWRIDPATVAAMIRRAIGSGDATARRSARDSATSGVVS